MKKLSHPVQSKARGRTKANKPQCRKRRKMMRRHLRYCELLPKLHLRSTCCMHVCGDCHLHGSAGVHVSSAVLTVGLSWCVTAESTVSFRQLGVLFCVTAYCFCVTHQRTQCFLGNYGYLYYIILQLRHSCAP